MGGRGEARVRGTDASSVGAVPLESLARLTLVTLMNAARCSRGGD